MKTTPLYQQHLRLGAKIVPFGGYDMPIQYESIIKEHGATRTAAAVFDTCHMGEFLIHGAAAVADLENLLSREIASMKIGSCRCAFLCNDNGGVIDDLIMYRLADDKFMMVVNAGGQDNDFEWVKSHLSANTKIKNISTDTAKIDIHGPESAKILSQILRDDIHILKYFCFMENFYKDSLDKYNDDDIIGGNKVIVSRTGYTGELGFELYCSLNIVEKIWDECITLGATPAGLGARDTLRLEMGYPLYGHELSADRNAAQSGLTYAISANKKFIGSDAIFADAVEQLLCGIKLDGRRSARSGDVIKDNNGNEIGVITSGSFSPTLGYAIALGYVEKSFAKIGCTITIAIGKSEVNGEIVELPFYKLGTARKQNLF